MKILIWKSHGDVDVICVETMEQLIKVTDDVLEMTKTYGYDEWKVLNERRQTISTLQPTKQYVALKQAVKSFVDQNCNGDDSFESFYFDTVKYQ